MERLKPTLWMMPLLAALVMSGCADEDSNTFPVLEKDAVFVVNGGSNSLSVIDVERQEVTSTLPLKDMTYPHHISLSPDRSLLVVAVPGMDLSGGHGGGHAGHSMPGKLLLLDAKTGETRVTRQFDAMTHNGAFSPDGTEVWTALMAEPGAVVVLDSQTLEPKQTIPVGDMPAEVTFSQDGRYAFVANGGSNNVTIIDAATKAVVKTVPVGANPVGAWPGNDGLMYVDNEDGKSLTAIDTSTLEVARTYPLGFTPAMAATAANGDLWVTDTDNGKVIFFAAGTTTRQGELATGAGAHGITFSADGATAFITNQTAGTLGIVDVAPRTLQKTLTVGTKPNGLVFRKN
ncbi:PQQ-binding-like beta-propeller repeat protein [Pyxidicoccus sp. 3LFB2]